MTAPTREQLREAWQTQLADHHHQIPLALDCWSCALRAALAHADALAAQQQAIRTLLSEYGWCGDGSPADWLSTRLESGLIAAEQRDALAAEVERLTRANRILELKAGGSLGNNLCPDHRDKQAGKPCLACEVESLRASRDYWHDLAAPPDARRLP